MVDLVVRVSIMISELKGMPIKNLRSKVLDQQAEIERQSMMITIAKDIIKDRTRTITELQVKKIALEDEIERLKADIEAMHKRFVDMNAHYGGQVDEIERLENEVRSHIKANGKLVSQCAKINAVVDDLQGLIAESTGVFGLHLNGDVASWDWLMDNEWLGSLAALEESK